MLVRLARIMILQAAFLMLLHNVVPHVHGTVIGHNDEVRVSTLAPKTLWNWLSGIFEIDLGEHHLEFCNRDGELANAHFLVDMIPSGDIPPLNMESILAESHTDGIITIVPWDFEIASPAVAYRTADFTRGPPLHS